MRFVFLALAVWGTVHPMWYFISWFQAEGVSLSLMVNAWHVWDRGKLWIALVFVLSISTKGIGCDLYSRDTPSRGVFLVAGIFFFVIGGN